MKKRLILLGILFVFAIIFLFFSNKFIIREYSSDLEYMNTSINIKVYTNDADKAKEALDEIEHLYRYYHMLSNRYQHYDDVVNLYDILHNKLSDEYLKIDPELYDVISYGLELLDKSNGILDIRMGNVSDVWKTYRDIGSGIPSMDELSVASLNTVKDITLKDGNLILNNHPNIDLDSIVKGYSTEKVGEYLESIGIKKYSINIGGNIRLGENYDESVYSIGLESPSDISGVIYKVVYGNNISIFTKGGYLDYYEYNNTKYHYIIDSNTLFPPTYSKSVTVICEDSILGDTLSTILFLLPVEDGKKYIEDMDNVEAVWYVDDNRIETTSGFEKYETKK